MDLSAVDRLNERPPKLLTRNRNLARDKIWNWCLPAFAVRLPDGRTVKSCPQAGVCRRVCYALNGTYRFRPVRERHARNLAYVLDDLPGWTAQMIAEIGRKRGPVIVRIHDAGDFLSDAYLLAWRQVMAAHPGVRFYTYTKEISLFRRLVEPDPPPNFKWVYSYGGLEDYLLDEDTDRVADVFPTPARLAEAGYHDQSSSDLLAVDGPAPVGIVANNIPQFLAKQGERTFGSWQQEYDEAQWALLLRRLPEPAAA